MRFLLYLCTRNPTKGCLHIIGGFCRHIKKAFIALCSDSMKCRKFQTDVSGLSNDRCPTGYRIVPLVPIWYVFCVYSYAHTRTLTMDESIFYIRRGLRVVGSNIKAMRQPHRVELAKASFTLFLYASKVVKQSTK